MLGLMMSREAHVSCLTTRAPCIRREIMFSGFFFFFLGKIKGDPPNFVSANPIVRLAVLCCARAEAANCADTKAGLKQVDRVATDRVE